MYSYLLINSDLFVLYYMLNVLSIHLLSNTGGIRHKVEEQTSNATIATLDNQSALRFVDHRSACPKRVKVKTLERGDHTFLRAAARP